MTRIALRRCVRRSRSDLSALCAAGWTTERAPSIMREQTVLSALLTELRKQAQVSLLGLDTAHDAVFMNETQKTYCADSGVVFTRCRADRKNDRGSVERKYGAAARRMVGFRRVADLEAARPPAELYRSAHLFANFVQPSFKLLAKVRNGAQALRSYSGLMTRSPRFLDRQPIRK